MTPLTACRVRDAMTYRPVAVGPRATLAEAARLLEDLRIGSLPVTEDGMLVGILTRLDVLKAFAPGGRPAAGTFDDVMATPVGGVMTRDPITVSPTTPLVEALDIMIAHRCSHVAVVVGALLVGILVRDDVARALQVAADPSARTAQA